jgi:cell division cycle 14
VDNGDMNWIIPGKFIAFSSPNNNQYDDYGYRTFTPEDYCPLFKKWGIGAVIRLNKSTYEKERFSNNGVDFYDMFFEDGTTPSDVSKI